jgi:glycosyltransferase involved in cell wall biosynthesis
LDALQLCRGDFDEVIIADDGSSSACVAELKTMIPSYPFPIQHVWQPKGGFRLAANRNNGIRHACGDYLVFLDCDFVVLPGTIRAHREHARPGRFVGGLCKYVTEAATDELIRDGVTTENIEELYRTLSEHPIKREHGKFFRYSILTRLHMAAPRKQRCSSHFSIHRSDMVAINGYDENFVGWGGEDEDLSLRMVKAGYHGYPIIRQARALHLWHPRELNGKHWREGPNIAYLYRDTISAFCENGLRRSYP